MPNVRVRVLFLVLGQTKQVYEITDMLDNLDMTLTFSLTDIVKIIF